MSPAAQSCLFFRSQFFLGWSWFALCPLIGLFLLPPRASVGLIGLKGLSNTRCDRSSEDQLFRRAPSICSAGGVRSAQQSRTYPQIPLKTQNSGAGGANRTLVGRLPCDGSSIELDRLEPKGGFEPPSEHYERSVFPTKLLRRGASGENRTLLASLEGWNSTNKSHSLT